MIKQIVIEPEDSKDALRHIKALDLALCIYDIQEYVRNKAKYSETCIPDEIRDRVYEIITDRIGSIHDYLD